MGCRHTAARVHELLSLVVWKPAEYCNRRPHELSGGQRQRVGVARALAADPPILLMDEPFGALDPVTRAELQREFSALARRLGKTIVFVTHDLREALLLASRIILLEMAESSLTPSPQEFPRIDHPEVRAFTASLAPLSGAPTMTPWTFFIEHRAEILEATANHLTLVIIAMAFAVAIGVPLGMLIVHRPTLRNLSLGLASIFQTIPAWPSSAFSFPSPSSVASVAAPPSSLSSFTRYSPSPQHLRWPHRHDPAVLEAAEAMGMTQSQILWRVRLPLARAVILAGIRTATIITIGVATIAAAIGAGGLGTFIFRGVAMVSDAVILAGAIPAALLAIAADLLLGWLGAPPQNLLALISSFHPCLLCQRLDRHAGATYYADGT